MFWYILWIQGCEGCWEMDAQQGRIKTLASIGTEGKAESICATLWDAIWIVWLLALFCLFYLQWIQVAVRQLGVKTLEGKRMENMEEHNKKNNKQGITFNSFLRIRNSAFWCLNQVVRQGPSKENIKAKVEFNASPSVPSRGQGCSVWAVSLKLLEIDSFNKSVLEAKKKGA